MASLLSLTPALHRCADALFEQQMWCWGCDVRCTVGNLLLAYGATQDRSPDPRYHSAYRFTAEDGTCLTLWGWGLWTAQRQAGSLFIRRCGFRVLYSPVFSPQPAAWSEAQLPRLGVPLTEVEQGRALQLLKRSLHWIADYERWLSSRVDADYRTRAVSTWPQRRRYRGGTPAAQMANAWSALDASLVMPDSMTRITAKSPPVSS